MFIYKQSLKHYLFKALNSMKTAFLILGAQRSGTSVTSHLLSQFQICFGHSSNFLQAEHNPIFFELKWVNQFNDQLIKSLGYNHTDCFLPLETDYDHPDVLEMSAELPALIRREWGDKPQIGIKDPRFSLTFPVWQSALVGEGYTLKIVFVFRCPSGFLHSNQRLFHNWDGWDETRHLHFWLRLNLAAIYFTRHFPICFVNYDHLINQPLDAAQQLADFFHFDQTDVMAAAAVVNTAYHHHQQTFETGYPLIEQYYQLLCSHRLSATDYLNYRARILAEIG